MPPFPGRGFTGSRRNAPILQAKSSDFNSWARPAPKPSWSCRNGGGMGAAGDGEPALAVERPDEVTSAAH